MAWTEIRDRIDWNRFAAAKQWRGKMNQPPRLIGGITVGCLLLLVLIVSLYSCSSDAPSIEPETYVYFYDLNDHALFRGKPDWTPPVKTPNGSDRGVLAHVYDCGSCGSNPLIGYLEIHKSPKAIPSGLPTGPEAPQLTPEGKVRLVAAPVAADAADQDAPVQFYVDTSPEGKEVLANAFKGCSEGQTVVECQPEPVRIPGT